MQEQVAAVAQLNLTQQLTAMFAAEGVENPSAWELKLAASYPVAASTTDPDYLRFLVNSFWRHHLGLCDLRYKTEDKNTMDARYCLVDQKIEDSELIKLYKHQVVPWIKKYNLPN